MQNDDYGKDYWDGFKEGLGKEAGRVVKHVTYEVTDPTVDSQIIQLKDSGANVFFNVATPKFAAQAIRKVADLGWKPAHYLNNVSASVATVMKPAGFDNMQGIITAAYLMDPTDPHGPTTPDMKEVARHGWRSTIRRRTWPISATSMATPCRYLMAETLLRCGDELTRANVMKQAASLQKFARADAAARHHGQHQPDRLLPDPGRPAAALQGPDVGAVRRDHACRGFLRGPCIDRCVDDKNCVFPSAARDL